MDANKDGSGRRDFLKTLAIAAPGGAGTASLNAEQGATKTKLPHASRSTDSEPSREISYPRLFEGPALAMISFPLGGIGAGSLGLGGRGQLRDWEIFNRPGKGENLMYAFPSVWVQAEGEKPITRVLESRIETPYEGADGLGSNNVPGLSRLSGATFSGEFPRAHIDFHDDRLPVTISLDAGTPFIPLDADASGLPLAVLHYSVRNHSRKPVSASIAFSLENPVRSPKGEKSNDAARKNAEDRITEWRRTSKMEGLWMTNRALPRDSPDYGSFVLAVLKGSGTNDKITGLTGWPAGRWWNSPLLFWDDFSQDGELGPEPDDKSAVGAVCSKRTIAPGAEQRFSFLLAWHFPNRTPQRCGWEAPEGHENTIIGNWYSAKYTDAWAVASAAADALPQWEERTRAFTEAIRESTIPASVKDAAMSNLSTLVSTTCFRTADGEFHAFEGVNDALGCCFGNCTHVWNYETATPNLFPSLSLSLRRSAFGYSMDERGAMYFRQLLPDGIKRFGYAAADGQMGQIIKAYMDWQCSGNAELLTEFWPKVKRAIEFAWIEGGWDANRDGVLEGVQHNTYDVEFYGPNPLCSIYYLAALRAAEEMARAAGDRNSAEQYRQVFEGGRRWIDANLFNGEYYVQKVQGHSPESIAAGLNGGMGADDPRQPQYQVGNGCLVDQLLGQYLADLCHLGDLVDPNHITRTLDSIYRYNHKANLYDHDTVQRTFALNDEAALVICDYGKGERPRIPFPYYAEVMTGFEHSTASLMLLRGQVERGLSCIDDIRKRYDGVRRNPYDEAECGHHYARAMAAWSGLIALSGFAYKGSERHLTISPRWKQPNFRCFWSTGTGWGTFTLRNHQLEVETQEGTLSLKSLELAWRNGSTAKTKAELDRQTLKIDRKQTRPDRAVYTFDTLVTLQRKSTLTITL